MKARFLALAALVLGLASCQNDFEAGNIVAGGEVDFQLSVGADELATRAGKDGADTQKDKDSAFGAIDYFQGADWNSVDLRYSLEVYDAKADFSNTTEVLPVKDRQVIIVDEYQPVVFDLRLVPNREYRFVVFADFVKEGSLVTVNDKTMLEHQANLGLHHTIGDDLRSITIKEDAINEECTDAYFAFEDIEITNSAAKDIVLRRPYGKLRVIATDLAELNLNVDPKAVKVTYTAKHPQTFNAVTGVVGEVEAVDYEFDYIYGNISKNSLAEHYYTAGYDAKTVENANGNTRHSHITLFTDYILAEPTSEDAPVQTPYHFTMAVYDNAAMADTNLIKETAFTTDIPVERNHLTTVIGNVLTTATEIEVRIDDNFANGTEWNPEEDDLDIEIVEVADQDSFLKALEDAAKKEYAAIELTGNVEWETGASHGSTPLIGADGKTQSLTIYGNGRELKATGKGVGPIRLANGGKLIFKDVVFVDESVSYNEGAWELGYLEFAGELEFINCEFKNAVMMCGGTANNDTGANATFTGCKFNSGDANQYDVWVSGDNAYFNECTFEGYRGIKVHEAYGSEVEEVVVDNCQFNNLSKKPGMAIGDVNAETAITIENSRFVNCQAGDQGLYIYETDTDVATFSFIEQNNVVSNTVTEGAKLDEMLQQNIKSINIELGADVELNASDAYLALGGDDTELIVIDGKKLSTAAATGATNGNYKLTLTTTYWSRFTTKNPEAKVILRNLTLTSTQESGTWNSYDVTLNCNVELENVELLKAVAFDGEGTTVNVKNVTIKESHDYYAMWISAAGQTVNIENLVIESAGRGIKIDEEYVNDAVAKVTLNINNAKFTTANKAAIMVKSAKGADITLQNVDITAVAADDVNAVWVDEDAAAYADLVTVTGGLKKVEGATATLGSETIPAGTYKFPAADKFTAETVLTCEEGTVFQGSNGLNINGATVVGATFSNPGGTAATGTINGSFKECDFVGSNGLRWSYAGETCYFENCLFEGSLYGAHFDGGANDVTYKNCVLSGFNTFAGAITQLTFDGCTFKDGPSAYNGANLWGSTTFKNCEFTFDGSASTEWIDCISATGTYKFENCTINGVPYTAENYKDFLDYIWSRNDITVEINGTNCELK